MLIKTHAQQAQGLLLDSRTHKIDASVSCRSLVMSSGCGDDKSFLSSRWEPGSVFKPILVATMINDGFIASDEVFSDEGYIIADGFRIDNYEGSTHQNYTIEQFLGTSRNTGAVTILKTLEGRPNSMDIWQARLEQIISNSQGYAPDFKHIKDARYRFYESSFGVGITITPLRLAQLYDAFQSKGEVCDQQGRCTHFISPLTADYMQHLLLLIARDYAGVTSKNSRCLFSGKSGTALAAQSTGTYFEDVNNGTYVGIIADTNTHHNKVLLVRLTAPNDGLASRPARQAWTSIANQICQNL